SRSTRARCGAAGRSPEDASWSEATALATSSPGIASKSRSRESGSSRTPLRLPEVAPFVGRLRTDPFMELTQLRMGNSGRSAAEWVQQIDPCSQQPSVRTGLAEALAVYLGVEATGLR